ncbi:MAG: hypothetical protein ACREJQ_00150 [bacterium]
MKPWSAVLALKVILFFAIVIALISRFSIREIRAQGRGPLGTNLVRIDDWSAEFPFVDAFKPSRPWISGGANSWDDRRTLDLDTHGWVSSLQSGQIARTLFFWDLSQAPGRFPAGRYTVLHDGEGTIQYTPNARRIESSRGREVIDVDPTRGGVGLFITATTPSNYIRNIRVLMPVNAAAGERFNPVFLDRIKNYKVIRFMDWMATNGDWSRNGGSQKRHWNDRPKLDDARWSNTHGVPLEVMVELANRLNMDAWFCMPHQADDDYVRRFAQAVRGSLNANLKIYVEYSNEVWNGGYAQAWYAQQQGLAQHLSANAYQAQIRYHAKRSREIFAIWESVFPKDRLVRVLGSHAANPWVSDTALSYGDTVAHTDALAIAPYFGFRPVDMARAKGMTLNQLFSELRTLTLPQVRKMMDQQAAVAKKYGVKLITYEGGQHLVALGSYQNDTTLNALFDDANRDARMGGLYSRHLQDWSDASGGQLFVHFTNLSRYGIYGRFGSLEYQAQPRTSAPKYDALQRFMGN